MASGSTAKSLAEYAREHKPAHSAVPWVETLPDEIRAEMIEGHKAGIGAMTILRWLRDEGYEDATYGRVYGYLSRYEG